jgi:citrate synthase
LAEAGVPSLMMRGVVLVARCAGLVGHILEESASPVGDALWKGAENAVSYVDE